jgi:hypothetical protein
MKIPVSVMIGFIIGIIIYNFRGESIITTYKKNDWYVSIIFTSSGKTMALSNGFNNQTDCLNSVDYQLHKEVSKESKVNIVCSNKVDIL